MTSPPRKVESRRLAALYKFRLPLLLAALFALLLLTHLTLLGLPYYWDEAGYFIPAARDIYADGSFIPHSTLSNAHPPLVMAYLALAWKLFGFHVEVARGAMLFVSALALTGVFRLAERVSNAWIGIATVILTAVYPVFFAQSSLAHLDMGVTALVVWGLVFYLPAREDEREAVRRVVAVALFALAALAKETAVLVPLTLFGWEIICLLVRRKEKLAKAVCLHEPRGVLWSSVLLAACVPLALWFAYHRARTGYTLGNPEYFRYNVESTLNVGRVLGTLWRRLGHVTFHMDLWALTLPAALAMLLPARRDASKERPRIAVPVQMTFYVLVLAHVFALSVVGGAVLARYMLPVLPLVVMVCVSTLWRRVRFWVPLVALACAVFAYRTEVNPSYNYPWEENLAYRDFVVLHRDAARFLADKYPAARVLTTWPATDELTNAYYGYADRRLNVVPVENFLPDALERAARRRDEYDVAFVFTTHGGPDQQEAARLLGGRVVFSREREGQWVAVVEKQ
ncbi:MAG TPA: glycosyltransferase family 39 protein [Pyrinomonadaceae bacterium]|jgi:4-amino-4-deoxy-L-arabinose transferase-like glycosyltransferase|nr:glycosyltransferase family 39 protein [Pyrinomonadaceae bacterium]